MMNRNPLYNFCEPPTTINELLTAAANYMEMRWDYTNQVIYLAMSYSYSNQLAATYDCCPREMKYDYFLEHRNIRTNHLLRKGWMGNLWLGTRFPAPSAKNHLHTIGLHAEGDGHDESYMDQRLRNQIETEYCTYAFFKPPSHKKKTLFQQHWKFILWEEDWKEILLANVIAPQDWSKNDAYGYHTISEWYTNFKGKYDGKKFDQRALSTSFMLE